MNRIHYVKPSITNLEIDLANQAVRNSWGLQAGDFVSRFEIEFAAKISSTYAIATSSCTGALELGLAALDLSPGDEVILADTNWVATVSPLIHQGIKPVFVDITTDTWCIDPSLIEAAITPKTRAVIATHLYGNACDLDQIKEICMRNNIYLIEDAAEAIGTTVQGKHVGTFGIFGVFSFHGSKTLTCGEGGMLVTNDAKIYKKVRQLNNHGRAIDETRQFWATEVGYKFRISDVQAAIGVGQVMRFEELTNRKRQILSLYRDLFSAVPDITLNPEVKSVVNGAWMPNIVFSADLNINIEDLKNFLNQNDIDARLFFWPLSTMKIFGDSKACPNAKSISERSLNLPSFHDMSDDDQVRVADAIKRYLDKELKIDT